MNTTVIGYIYSCPEGHRYYPKELLTQEDHCTNTILTRGQETICEECKTVNPETECGFGVTKHKGCSSTSQGIVMPYPDLCNLPLDLIGIYEKTL